MRAAGWLAHPLTRGLDVDDPRTSELRRRIIREKEFLRRVYLEWYALIRDAMPVGPGPVLELGAGGGFLGEMLPDVIASDVMPLAGGDVALAGEALPFRTGSLRAIAMTNVFHHQRGARAFLRDAARAVRGGGRLVMVEPWNTTWSRVVHRALHDEPFDPDAAGWALAEPGGPLSGANGALPWIVFERDRATFAHQFPEWRIIEASPFMPFAYLLSGGVSLRLQAPPVTYGAVRRLERLLPERAVGMFALITLERDAE